MQYLRIDTSVLTNLPEALETAGICRPFVLLDANTREAAWPQTEAVLRVTGIFLGATVLRQRG